MNLLRDVRFAVRLLARNKTFALAALIVVALGIGATTSVFSVVRAVLLQPLPYREPDRLEHVEVSVAERELIERGLGADAGHALEATQWKRLLANRTVVCLCLMYFTQAFGGTFYVT